MALDRGRARRRMRAMPRCAPILLALAVLVLCACGPTRVAVPDPRAPSLPLLGAERVVLTDFQTSAADQQPLLGMVAQAVTADTDLAWQDARAASQVDLGEDAIRLAVMVETWQHEPDAAWVIGEYWTSGGGPGRRVRERIEGDRARCVLTVTLARAGHRVQRSVVAEQATIAPDPRRPSGMRFWVAGDDRARVHVGRADPAAQRHAAARAALRQVTAAIAPAPQRVLIELAAGGGPSRARTGARRCLGGRRAALAAGARAGRERRRPLQPRGGARGARRARRRARVVRGGDRNGASARLVASGVRCRCRAQRGGGGARPRPERAGLVGRRCSCDRGGQKRRYLMQA